MQRTEAIRTTPSRAPKRRSLSGLLATFWLAMVCSAFAQAMEQRDFSTSDITKVLMLGSGNPYPDPERSGPAVAVIVNGTPYIVDAGEGIWRAMGREMQRFGGGAVEGFEFTLGEFSWSRIFLTHLHSDHTLGLPAAILAPWNMRRADPPHVYGPPGTKDLVDGILAAYRHDIAFRVYGDEALNDTGWRAVAHEIWEDGTVYKDANVTVSAFRTEHSTAPMPYAYRFETPDRVVTVSGDVRPSPGMLEAARGADILVHEVYGLEGLEKRPHGTRNVRRYHTSTEELAELARQVNPQLLVLYHVQSFSDDPNALEKEIRGFGFEGRVIESRDRDIY